ncbi:MAG: hypothetical protein ACKO0M_02740 [Cyanobium sp.]
MSQPPKPVPVAPASPAEAVATDGLTEAEFQTVLQHGSLEQLDAACRKLADDGDALRLRLLRERLLSLAPAPQTLSVLLANAGVLLDCRMPVAAMAVLDRISPAAGSEQMQWLTLQWRAANAALDHRRAAIALERLAAYRPERLEAMAVPLGQRDDGSWVSRSALEMLASHLTSLGFGSSAAYLLLLSRNQDAASAERQAQALRLLADLSQEMREPLFERVLEQAAAAGSWGLVGELLTFQASLPASPEAAARTAERRLRLSRRLDDAYGEWRALQRSVDPRDAARIETLLRQLRSPQEPGGHAAPQVLPPPSEGSGAAPPPPSTVPPAG